MGTDASDQMVDDMPELSDNAKNLWMNLGVRTLGELADKTTRDLRRERGCTRAMVQEIEAVLGRYGLKLRG